MAKQTKPRRVAKWGQARFAPQTPQNEPVPGGSEIASGLPAARRAISLGRMDVLSLSERARAESWCADEAARIGRAFDGAAMEGSAETSHPHPNPLLATASLRPKGEGTRHPSSLLATASLRPEGEGGARGVGWVVRWACAVGVLAWSASLLAEFACALVAEQSLARAARAGAIEATLPRATGQSIHAVVASRLDAAAIPRAGAKMLVSRNGSPVGGAFRPRPGDRVMVTLSVPASAVLPGWLQAVPWSGGRPITVRAERELPRRTLR